jgi:hypothetical protein
MHFSLFLLPPSALLLDDVPLLTHGLGFELSAAGIEEANGVYVAF